MRRIFPAALVPMIAATTALTPPATAADATVTIEIPRLKVVEYHRPYVALWVERPDNSFVANLAVRYDVKLKNKEGNKWLKDLRMWWRRSGRALDMPVDGISGATLPVGTHSLAFEGSGAPLGALPAGDYQVVIEAAREVGGREVLRVPFAWPPKVRQRHDVKGSHELGAVTLQLDP
ncbi:MAG: DUF2271 domain-containing protein [Alphaproteobacteria bacterium]